MWAQTRNMSTRSEIPTHRRITLSWSNVNVVANPRLGVFDKLRGRPPKPSVHILKEVSGVAEPGTLMAFMGASGAGKTTLMNVLTNRGTSGLEVTGDVFLNGQTTSEFGASLGELVGYVQQHDILPPTLTVREYLVFSATMTMYKRLTAHQIQDKVDDLLTQFSMLECADTLIDVGSNCISGSERKRVSVIAKLFGERRLLFLDEPTTGLDSYVAKLLVENLRSLADRGYNIVCTIHQPASCVFNMFDQLFLLAEGRSVYFGQREEAVDYFASLGYECPATFSPADYLIDILAITPGSERVCSTRVKLIADAYDRSSMVDDVMTKLVSEHQRVLNNERIEMDQSYTKSQQAPWLHQLVYLGWRCTVGLWRNPLLILLRFTLIACACALLVVIYMHPTPSYTVSRANSVQGLLFFMSSFFIIFNSILILSVLPTDLPLIIREHRDGLYHLSAYYLTTFFVQSVIGALFMIGSVSAIYFVTGLQRDDHKFYITMAILIIIFLVNVGFAAVVSSIYETAGETVSQAIPLVFLSNVLGGYFCLLNSIPRYLDPIMYINWLPWGYEMVSINQWYNVTDIACNDGSCVQTGDDVLNRWGLNKDAFTKDLILILVQLTGYHVVAYTILSLKMKYKWSG